MKVRSGFVSNSSSSSFILGLRGDDAKVTISIEIDLSKYGELIETKEQLERYVLDEYGYLPETSMSETMSHVQEIYGEMLAHIESGKKVLCGEFNSAYSEEENLLRTRGLPESDSYVIIQGVRR